MFSFDPPPVQMPIVQDDYYKSYNSGPPIAERDPKYIKWLQVSVKIMVSQYSGSGTIIYYDGKEYAYIQSCGHLWDGNMSAEQGKSRKITCRIAIWYQNGKKLANRKEYEAEVLYYSNVRGYDCSLLRFKPDWYADYIPIAPLSYPIIDSDRLPLFPNKIYHSCGCDHGSEVANYSVKIIKLETDYITKENSPRPGRSGGGLMTDDYYIGICWGTSDVNGTGTGLFTPLSVVRELNKREGYGWLNDVGNAFVARKIPIIDRNNAQKTYPDDYIPVPNP